MPVEIPRLKRIQPSQGLAGNERFNFKVKDNSAGIADRTDAIMGLANDGLDFFQETENRKIDQISTTTEMEFKNWNAAEMQRIQQIEGDPTEAYAKYQEDKDAKIKEIFEPYQDSSERVQRHIDGNFGQVENSVKMRVMKQEGQQQHAYSEKVYEAGLKLDKREMPESASNIIVGNKASFNALQEDVEKIQTRVAKRAVDNGLGEVLPADSTEYDVKYLGYGKSDSEGDGDLEGFLAANELREIKVKLNPIAQQDVAKHLSEGLTNTINVMLDTPGQEEAAMAVRKKYAPYIDPTNKAKISKKVAKNDLTRRTNDFMQKHANKPPAERRRLINNLKATDYALFEKTFSANESVDTKRAAGRARRTKMIDDTILNRVLEAQGSKDLNQRFNGTYEMENDDVIKRLWEGSSPKAKKAARALVKSAKTTSPEAEYAMQNLVFGKDPNGKVLEGMTPEEFAIYKTGLDDNKQKIYDTIYRNANTESGSKERARNKRMEGFLSDALFENRYLTKERGFFTPESEKRLIEARNQMIKYLDTYSGDNLTEKQQIEWVEKYAADVKIGEFKNPQVPEVQARRDARASAEFSNEVSKGPKSTGPVAIPTTTKEIQNLMPKYFEKHGTKVSPGSKEFRDFVLEWRRQNGQ